jgi:phage recombination protein Bet
MAIAEQPSAAESREIAVFQQPRLPYHPALRERFGVEASGWKALVESVYPSARTVDAVVLALSYCKARNLDPFKRPVHVVPMWDSKANNGKGGYVETIWPGISELRTTAFRTGNYAGCDEAEFGPEIERTFKGRLRKGQEWETKEITLRFPEWCRITVYRVLGNRVCKFVGPKVRWLESYATIGKSELPNDMWRERAEGQNEKCAEAAALRRAFPEELGNELTAEEMAGRIIQHDDGAVERVTPPQSSSGPPAPDVVKNGAKTEPQAQAQPEVIDVEAEEVEALPMDENPAPAQQQHGASLQAQTTLNLKDGFTDEEREWLRNLEGAFGGCEDMVSFGIKQKEIMTPQKKSVSSAAWTKAQQLAEDTFKRLQG